jgi:hypothetical protein
LLVMVLLLPATIHTASGLLSTSENRRTEEQI